MRYINHLLILASLSATLATPINTHELDVELKEIKTPQDVKLKCDMKDPTCKGINGSGFHSVNEFEGHLGKQAGILASTGSKVAADENQNDLSETLRNDGPVIKQDLQGRARPMDSGEGFRESYMENQYGDHGADASSSDGDIYRRQHSEVNKDLKMVGHGVYPDEEIKETGEGIERQGKAGQHTGEGVHDVTKEAHRQFGVISAGFVNRCDEFANAVVN